MKFPEGESYTGEWLNDMMHGFGIFKFKDGSRFEGKYKNGLK